MREFVAVPPDFQEAVEQAAARPPEIAAPTLALLEKEAEASAWAQEGARVVARARDSRKERKAPTIEAPAQRDRVIVATGHRADAVGRKTPRFPNTPDCIAKAKDWLKRTLEAERGRAAAGHTFGIGGGASGTDLLFHQVCAELGIPTKLVLAIPVAAYRSDSVADGGPDWVEMFNNLVAANPPILLSDRRELPPWAVDIPSYSVFQRGNIWMMEDALLRPNADVTLVALWNGQAGDGPGGTADMVKLAREHGARTLIANTNELFGLA